jgi:hypothetical protein
LAITGQTFFNKNIFVINCPQIHDNKHIKSQTTAFQRLGKILHSDGDSNPRSCVSIAEQLTTAPFSQGNRSQVPDG